MQPRIKTINLVWMDFISMPPRVRFAARRLKDIRVSCWGNPAASGFLEHDSGRQSRKKNNESNGEGKAVEKVKHQEKYERHVKWELAMEIELYFT